MAPTWRIRLALSTRPESSFELDVTDEMILGTSPELPTSSLLEPFKPHSLGVSRQHLRLKPIGQRLAVSDLSSTNGTWLNGQQIRPETDYPLSDGDTLALGRMEFLVRLLQGPPAATAKLGEQVELSEILTEMAKTITAQLNLDGVLDRVLEVAMATSSAGEVGVWLVDEQTGELFLEAERGIRDEKIRRMRLPTTDSLVGQALESREPLRLHRAPDGNLVKVKTGYLVEALLYVPLILGGEPLGVIAATHREQGKVFSARDEKLLASIADFAAIAVHNARLYQKLQHADQAKGEMIQNISHEFRTPLTYIVSYVELLLDENSRLQPDQQRNLEIVQLQANKLVWLVKNFVALHSPEDIARRGGVTDVSELLVRVAEGAQLQAEEADISVTVRLEEELPKAAINRMALFQVMDNLLSNALKFTEAGGEIDIEARHIEGNKVLVSVADNGIGIPEDKQEQIFERFWQLDGSMTRAYGGVGLGLAVCHNLITAYGERIWVESEPGQGATFYFTLTAVEDGSPPA